MKNTVVIEPYMLERAIPLIKEIKGTIEALMHSRDNAEFKYRGEICVALELRIENLQAELLDEYKLKYDLNRKTSDWGIGTLEIFL